METIFMLCAFLYFFLCTIFMLTSISVNLFIQKFRYDTSIHSKIFGAWLCIFHGDIYHCLPPCHCQICATCILFLANIWRTYFRFAQKENVKDEVGKKYWHAEASKYKSFRRTESIGVGVGFCLFSAEKYEINEKYEYRFQLKWMAFNFSN